MTSCMGSPFTATWIITTGKIKKETSTRKSFQRTFTHISMIVTYFWGQIILLDMNSSSSSEYIETNHSSR